MILQRIFCRNVNNTLRNSCIPQQNFGIGRHFDLRTAKNSRNYVPRRPTTTNRPIQGENPFGIPVNTGPVPPNNIVKSATFALAFSAGSFLGASIWEYETIRSKIRDRKSLSNFNWFKNKFHHKKAEWRREIDSWWSTLTPGQKLFVPICVLNSVVFLLWRVPTLQPMMIKYFCSNPAARVVCWPMFLSTFSHYSLFHIFANMYVLHSFMTPAVMTLGKEQFLGLYLSAGVFASFASYVFKARSKQIGLSLGASGAIMAVLSFVCCEYPDTQLSILFLPMLTFPAGAAIKVIMGFDLAGCILGWKLFDHAAHLGGAFFGLFWCYWGRNLIWPERQQFLRFYHELRSPKS